MTCGDVPRELWHKHEFYQRMIHLCFKFYRDFLPRFVCQVNGAFDLRESMCGRFRVPFYPGF